MGTLQQGKAAWHHVPLFPMSHWPHLLKTHASESYPPLGLLPQRGFLAEAFAFPMQCHTHAPVPVPAVVNVLQDTTV